jgi:predicted enzyme related to lactoylglutathione lyase
METNHSVPRPFVHLELHTGDKTEAEMFLRRLFRWRLELLPSPDGSYLALEIGGGIGGGIVECGTRRPQWLPYVEVGRIDQATEVARRLGAAVLLTPREGPAGWRSVVSSPAAGEIALWQAKP